MLECFLHIVGKSGCIVVGKLPHASRGFMVGIVCGEVAGDDFQRVLRHTVHNIITRRSSNVVEIPYQDLAFLPFMVVFI